MLSLVLVCQILALVCFFIGWMSWIIPTPPRRAWAWMRMWVGVGLAPVLTAPPRAVERARQ